MKKTLFITILLLLAIIVVGLVIFNDKQSVEPVVNTNVATTSAMSNVPSPLTLASLQARPDWNPTMEVEEVAGLVHISEFENEVASRFHSLNQTNNE